MNTLLAWFNSPEWMIVVKTLLHTLWQAVGLALLLWIALRRVATPAMRYRLTLGTLVAILGTTLLTWAVLNQSATEPAAPDFASPTTPARKPSDISPAANFGEPSVIAYSTPIVRPAEETRWSGWLALAWMLGSALMLTRAGIQVAGAERLRRSCQPLDDSRITQLLAEAQRALNLTRRIRVAVTDKLTSPAVVGVIVPTLILPLTLLTTLTPEQIRFILLHELAHIRRGDYFANLFQLFIEALLFFNPAVWWISHQVRREREACCDTLAIELSGAPVDYARTLLHVAETVLNPPPAAAPAFSENQSEPSSLTDRVQRLLVPGYRPALRLTWRAMLAAIVVGGTLLFLSAVGARNVVGAVSTNSSEKATKPATNVVENVSDNFSNNKANSTGKRGGLLDFDFSQYGDTQEVLPLPRFRKRVEGDSLLLKDLPFVEALFSKQESISISNKLDPWGNPYIITPFTGRGRASISNKLDQITFDKISFDHQPLSEVLRTLSAKVRKLDPEKRGVNLILNPNSAATVASTNAPPSTAPEPPLVYVSVKPELTNATLRTVLDAIVKGADQRIVYYDEEYAVVFSLKGYEIVPLHARMFHVDPDRFFQGLDAVTGWFPDIRSTNDGFAGRRQKNGFVIPQLSANGGGNQSGQSISAQTRTNNMETVHAAIRKFFAIMGVTLDPSVGKTVFFNDREGSLYVRATSEELDIIEQVIRVLNIKPPQVNIKVRWVEIPKSLPHPDAWPLEFRSNNFSAILTQKQAAEVLNRIERTDGIDLLNEGQLTTLTERQAQISFAEVKTVVTGINPKALTKPGVISTNTGAPAYLETESTPLGPVFDVIPTVSADEVTISLHMTATYTEFLGYDKAAKEIPIYVNGKKRKTTLPLPKYQIRQMTNNTVVPDGATLILGNLPTREVAKQPNGEMRTNDVTSVQTNLLFILVTPTIIDPAGNRADPAPFLHR